MTAVFSALHVATFVAAVDHRVYGWIEVFLGVLDASLIEVAQHVFLGI